VVIGVLHPGEMGGAVGAALTSAGRRVLWASEGRGAETAARAASARLVDAGSISALAGEVDLLVSVCPPHAAMEVAAAAAGVGYQGVYLDANAISPGTARQVARRVQEGGATYVDGGIVGPPPRTAGSTRLYLSGADGGRVAAAFDGTALLAVPLTDGGAFAASALKMAYAAWTKGSAALLLGALAAARANGVDEALKSEWELSIPELPLRAEGAAASGSSKGWRWVGEMEEIAATFAAAGLPAGFHEAAATVYRAFERGGSSEAGAETLEAALRRLAPELPQ
jgi:3-hydroxyisobutyrate dehydrogenase-like beta-hydroxyacid dehydrogenase